jgi:ribosomal protein L30E
METREIIIDNAQAIELQQAIIDCREEGKPIIEVIEALMENNKETVAKIKEEESKLDVIEAIANKNKDKLIPIVREEIGNVLGEEEEIQSVEIRDGKMVVIVINAIELYRKHYIERVREGKENFKKAEEEKEVVVE